MCIRDRDISMEEAVVSAVTDDTSEAKITVAGVPDRPGVAAKLFRELANRGINLDMIVQNTNDNVTTDISFTVPKDDLEAARETCDKVRGDLGATSVTTEDVYKRQPFTIRGTRSRCEPESMEIPTISTSSSLAVATISSGVSRMPW